MPRPKLSVIIPTIGRLPGLERALDSISVQPPVRGWTEIVVVGDTLDGPLPAAEALAREYGARYVEHAGPLHCVGHPQRQYGMGVANGEWLAFLADDDIWTEGALPAIYAAIDEVGEPQPLLFRVQMNWLGGHVVWDTTYLAVGNIDAECIVVPNDPARLGTWEHIYAGDFSFILETCRKWGRWEWRPELIAIARPTEAEDWMARVKVEATA
jgi:glycosyltransferase involved in cell wall biosynthesis